MITFKTESGSTYTLGNRQWSSTSQNTRTKGGEMYSHTEVVLGRPVTIVGPGLLFGTRLVVTTPVVEIVEIVEIAEVVEI